MPSIILPEHLSVYVNGAVRLTAAFATVKEAVAYLEKTYPELYQHLFDQNGEVNSWVNFYLNAQSVTSHLKEEIPIGCHDNLEIVTAALDSQ